MKLEEKLGLIRYNIDKEPHIIVQTEECEGCKNKPCIAGCPAGCFKIEDDKFRFQYEDCVECGTCKILCTKRVIEWNYPRGTFGVAFQFG